MTQTAGGGVASSGPPDSAGCEREPIHLVAAIQPHGFLIIAAFDWHIAGLSANASDWLGRPVEGLLGLPLRDVLRGEAVHAIRNRVGLLVTPDAVERVFGVSLFEDGVPFDLAIHVSGGRIILEFERSEAFASTVATPLGAMIARLQRAQRDADLCREAARQLRALTGFDRVMVYRFLPDGSGEVIAEAMGPGLESYLGLRYPESDIPSQARALYERNWVRMITDVEATPVEILPRLDPAGGPIDLSFSVLRAVSPLHLEYLRNMGVVASMSVSVMRQGRLWGLLACHHGIRRHIGLARRTAAELFGQVFSLLLESRERDQEAEHEARARRVHDQLMAAMAVECSTMENMRNLVDAIAELVPCGGVAIWVEEALTLKGNTPPREACLGLVQFLNRAASSRIYATHELGRIHEPARAFADRAAGLLAIPVSRVPRDYILLFRGEVARSVVWAGDPAKAMTVGPQGGRFSPRKSFEAWREVVRGQATPWTDLELRVAEALRMTLLEVILRLAAAAERERKAATERQERLIAELNHRVRNVLGLMRGVITQSRDGATSVDAFATALEARVQALARAHDQITHDHGKPGALRGLIAVEAEGYVTGRAERIRGDGPDLLLQQQAFSTVALVVHELMSNAVQHGALREPAGQVDIVWTRGEAGDLAIEWTEQGGPPVHKPQHQGFGTTLIERSIPHDLQGEATLDWRLAGLHARLVVPARFVAQAPAAPGPEAAAAPPRPVRLSGDVLVVEDNLVIALDSEGMLARLGAERVHIANSLAEAMHVLDVVRPTLAVLDVNLGEETSLPVATRLLALGVPYCFATGYGEEVRLSAEHQHAPIVTKPYSVEMLAAGIGRLQGK